MVDSSALMKVEGHKRQRRSIAEKRRIVELAMLPGASVAGVARQHGVNANMVHYWRGEFFRRMRAKLGTAQAITATAHKIARILYHVLLTKQPYAETVFHRCDEQAHQRAEMRLRKQAAQLGFQVLPIAATGQ